MMSLPQQLKQRVWRVLATATLATSAQAQMAMPGSFAVSPSGAATYTVPIQVPPGVGGLAPNLALVYNSQGGNGLLGVGWSLSGLSSITRCPRTMAQDGVRGGVNHDLNDRYCLDGQRLIAVKGADGGDGTEYRTESEDYSRITSYAETGATNGPGSFIVKTRSGLTMEFGKTADSRIEAQGKATVIVWALSRVSDNAGNYYMASYTEDNVNGQFYPSRIDYTGNAANTPVTATTNALYFNYQPRTDTVPIYRAGSLNMTTVRLIKVIARTGTNAAMDITYQLTYDSIASRSSPQSIKRCAGGDCSPETKFSSTYGGTGFAEATLWGDNNNWANVSWKGVEDFNGDGLPDLWYVEPNSSRVFVRLSTGSGFAAATLWGESNNWAGLGWMGFSDFNGDGLPDLWYVEPNSSRVLVRLSTGSGFAAATLWGESNNWAGLGWMGFSDFNGDGLADLWYVEPNSSRVFVRLSTGSGFAAATLWGESNNWAGLGWMGFSDFNGDGLSDLWYVEPNSSRMFVRLSTGTGFAAVSLWGDNSNWANVSWKGFEDFNGDGLPDLWYVEPNSSRVFVRLSTGKGFAAASLWADNNNWSTVDWKGFQDFNGDGLPDLWYVEPNSSRLFVRLSTGTGFAAASLWADNNNWSTVDWKGFQDFNGDGLPDLWYVEPNSSRLFVRLSSDVGGVQLKFVDSGFTSLSLTYASLPQAILAGRYARNLSVSIPKLIISSPSYKVLTLQQLTNGIGGLRDVQYYYNSFMVERDGRGSLGFQWTQTKDVSTGLVSRTYYRQDFPFIGQVDKVGRGTSEADWYNLGLTTYKYTFKAFGPTDADYATPVTCVDDATTGRPLKSCTDSAIKPGNRYVPYTHEVLDKNSDWSADQSNAFIALPQTRTTTTQDNWGNATQIKVETLKPDGSASGYSKSTSTVFAEPDKTNWRLGRVIKSSVTSSSP